MKKIFTLLLLLNTLFSSAQDLDFGRKMLDTLTSTHFWGRGYTNDGMKKAADFLAAEFKAYGLQPLEGKIFLQPFSYPVNSFPGRMYVSINGKELVPGKDYIVGAESKGAKASGELMKGDSVQFFNRKERLVVKLQDKLTWTVATEAADYTTLLINKKAINGEPRDFEVNIENKFISNFKTSNVCAVVKGTAMPDSFIFFTAHYDHLGGMGKDTYFPGANDNASGVSLLLNLAQYYARHPQKYSIAFICFAGEEAGLIGSKYFTDNPLVPLKQIRFLINTDLAGTGEDGIMVVNATEFTKEFEWMKAINTEHKLLADVKARGKAANSDHYFFTEKGVPSFFFYTMGGIQAYHDVFDKAATLPLNEHEDLFNLLIKFNEKLMGQ
ncbi:MAG TPA: M28 family peptidase [Ferruginibacter sp.]|nr:M28 family peptidase [Ferruginibacter sp.]HPH90583.1 M28 family peptidase [Ferruginibacter sp.]